MAGGFQALKWRFGYWWREEHGSILVKGLAFAVVVGAAALLLSHALVGPGAYPLFGAQ